MKKLQTIGNFIFAGFLCLVLVQTIFKWCPEGKLYGETGEKEALPAPTISSWFDGSFQRAFESWFNKQAGFRSVWVRTHNQINFSVFRDISAKSQNPIVLGKENWLYALPYISAYVNPRKVHRKELISYVNRLEKFQDELERRDIFF